MTSNAWRRRKTTAPSLEKKGLRGGARRRWVDSRRLASTCGLEKIRKRCRKKLALNRGRKHQDGDEFVGAHLRTERNRGGPSALWRRRRENPKGGSETLGLREALGALK